MACSIPGRDVEAVSTTGMRNHRDPDNCQKLKTFTLTVAFVYMENLNVINHDGALCFSPKADLGPVAEIFPRTVMYKR